MLELIISMTLWGTLGVFVLWSGLPAIDIAFYRCLIGAVVMGCCLLYSRDKVQLNKNTGIVALAGIFLVMNWIFLFKSFQVSTITIGNISYYLQPVMLIILGIFIYKEKVSLEKWMLILAALFGVMLTIDIHQLAAPHIMQGFGLAIIAALLYSFVTILMKNNKVSFFKVIFIQLAIGVVILLPFVRFQQLSMTAIACLLVIGFVHTILAYFLYYSAIKKTNFTQIAVFSYLDPIVAIATDVIFFDRHLNVFQLCGIGLTFSALYMLVTSSRRVKRVVVDAPAAGA